jgi:hypothetical protein
MKRGGNADRVNRPADFLDQQFETALRNRQIHIAAGKFAVSAKPGSRYGWLAPAKRKTGGGVSLDGLSSGESTRGVCARTRGNPSSVIEHIANSRAPFKSCPPESGIKFEIRRSLIRFWPSPCQYIRGNGEIDRPNTPSMAPPLDTAGTETEILTRKALQPFWFAANGRHALMFITGVTHVRI